MNEVVLVPTYHRPEMLFYCLSRIREFEPEIPVYVFPDRDSRNELADIEDTFDVEVMFIPDHHYYGNTYNTMEAFRWAYNQLYDLVYLLEDDVMVHSDFFSWHREVHEECPDIFCSMAWPFNREAPITDDWLFQPWYYSIGTCFQWKKLELIAHHASPLYYDDMQGYIGKHFKRTAVHNPDNVVHYEQDGLIQRIIDEDRTQTVSCGIAKCSHLGVFGYNAGWDRREPFFEGCGTFKERVQRISNFLGDPYARADYFGRKIVEREIGHVLPKREFRYHIKVGEFESELVSELDQKNLPRRINSVPVTPDMVSMISS